MKKPAIPDNDAERIATLDELGIVYSPAEERYDRITRLAQRIFKVPTALVSLVTANTQWFKSRQGLDADQTPREISFCGHAILGDEWFIIPDTHKDPDFADNPLVTGEPYIRFYAGYPIRLNSVKLGTFCIIDQRPRRFLPADKDSLKSLALWVENEMKLSLYSASQKELLQKLGEMQRQELIDTTTQCWNERGIDKLIYQELERSRREDKPVAFMLIDLENVINGHKEMSGKLKDRMFADVAEGIRKCTRNHDVVGKLDSAQFFVFSNNCSREECRYLAQRILRELAVMRIKLEEGTIPVTAKIGMTSNEKTDYWSQTLLMETVEKALETARHKKSANTYHFEAPELKV